MAKKEPEKNKGGAPSKWKDEFVEQAGKLSLLGLTDEQMASYFSVAVSTFDKWKASKPEFLQALKSGKEIADGNVAASLYHRACGYSHPEDKVFLHEGEPVIVPTIKHYPPDTGACMAWLKNRQRDLFRDRPEQEKTDGDNIEKAANALEKMAKGLPD